MKTDYPALVRGKGKMAWGLVVFTSVVWMASFAEDSNDARGESDLVSKLGPRIELANDVNSWVSFEYEQKGTDIQAYLKQVEPWFQLSSLVEKGRQGSMKHELTDTGHAKDLENIEGFDAELQTYRREVQDIANRVAGRQDFANLPMPLVAEIVDVSWFDELNAGGENYGRSQYGLEVEQGMWLSSGSMAYSEFAPMAMWLSFENASLDSLRMFAAAGKSKGLIRRNATISEKFESLVSIAQEIRRGNARELGNPFVDLATYNGLVALGGIQKPFETLDQFWRKEEPYRTLVEGRPRHFLIFHSIGFTRNGSRGHWPTGVAMGSVLTDIERQGSEDDFRKAVSSEEDQLQQIRLHSITIGHIEVGYSFRTAALLALSLFSSAVFFVLTLESGVLCRRSVANGMYDETCEAVEAFPFFRTRLPWAGWALPVYLATWPCIKALELGSAGNWGGPSVWMTILAVLGIGYWSEIAMPKAPGERSNNVTYLSEADDLQVGA